MKIHAAICKMFLLKYLAILFKNYTEAITEGVNTK